MDSELLKLNSNYDIKMEILKATTALVDEVPFDKLAIGAICKAANISRTTFYRFFDDKFAVAQWYANYAFAQGTNEIGVSLPWYEGYYITEVLMTDQVAFSKGLEVARFQRHRQLFAAEAPRKALRDHRRREAPRANRQIAFPGRCGSRNGDASLSPLASGRLPLLDRGNMPVDGE